MKTEKLELIKAMLTNAENFVPQVNNEEELENFLGEKVDLSEPTSALNVGTKMVAKVLHMYADAILKYDEENQPTGMMGQENV